MTRAWIAALVLPLVLAGCGGSGGGDGDVVEQGSAAPAASDSPTEEASAGQLVEYGVGQDGQYAVGMAVVKNTADHGGQTVTVSMNFLDPAGEVITTETQIESFAYAGQTVALQVFADLGKPNIKVASVEPTLLVEDEGTFSESDIALDPVEATEITQQYGAWDAKFPIENPTAEPVKDLRVGVVCKNAAGEIVGGTTTYPDLLPPNGSIVANTNGLTVSEKPATCTAYPSPAGF